MSKIWLESEINWLKNNFPFYGNIKLSEMSRFSVSQIKSKGRLLGLKKKPDVYKSLISHQGDYIHPHMKKDEYIKFSNGFINIESPYHAYVLGFIWADGYVTKPNSKKYMVRCDLSAVDGPHIYSIFKKTGEWKQGVTKASGKNKNNGFTISITNKFFHQFLAQNGFWEKSLISADSILEKIPEYYHPYFIRGFFDGDGCIAKTRNTVLLAGNINTDFSYLEKILQKHNITYSIRINSRINNGIETGGKSLVIDNAYNIIKFYNYIYNKNLIDFGLERKKNIFNSRLFLAKRFLKTKYINNKLPLGSSELNGIDIFSIANDSLIKAGRDRRKKCEKYTGLLRKLSFDVWHLGRPDVTQAESFWNK